MCVRRFLEYSKRLLIVYHMISKYILFAFTTRKMKLKLLFSFLFIFHISGRTLADSNGGASCAACAVVFGLVEQTSVIHEEGIVQAFDRVCNYLPGQYQKSCKTLLEYLTPILIEILEKDDTPDVICLKLGLCFEEKNRTCTLFPLKEQLKPRLKHFSQNNVFRDRLAHLTTPLPGAGICDLPGVKEVCNWINLIFDNHDPAVDLDGDRHSTYETLRGFAWRGKDCDDSKRNIHPGARPVGGDLNVDSNCNGIKGINPSSQRPYETDFCAGSDQRGIVVLGDSISAHFHLPKEWLMAEELSLANFEPLPYILENEIDWPAFSYGTGYMNATDTLQKVIHGKTDSLYYRLWQRNRCNFRDYQNIAVNGARAETMEDKIEKSLYRNQTGDFPVIAIYALVGNDVCNGHPDTFAHMTTPAQMRQYATESLNFLDEKLPSGSFVFLTGLADGRVLYNSLSDRIHPIGSFRKDVTYSHFYDYFNCLEISPCSGWMNTNETVRDLTTQRAMELSGALEQVVNQTMGTYKNIKVFYNENPILEVIKQWVAAGRQTYELLEPVDGFHANQVGNAETARVIWEEFLQKWPQVLGKVNPFNEKIEAIFGDQGGYR